MCAERFAGFLLALLCALLCTAAPSFAQAERPRVLEDDNLRRTLIDESAKDPKSAPAPERADLPRLDLQARLKDAQVTTTPAGDIVTVETDQGQVQLTATEYVRALALTKAAVEHGGVLYRFFNISKPWGFVWITVGFLGQAMFTFRMVLQWLASEKQKRSVIPVGFWWGSLIGGAMLFAYFIWRKDIVGIVGQSTGVFIYARNLVLIYSGKRIDAQGEHPLEQRPATT